MSISRRRFFQGCGATILAPACSRAFPFDEGVRARICRKLATDPLRPQYHFLPAQNWMNDPNGPLFYRGRYHMFHQYNPEGAVWGNMNWAHASSPDMIHWRHEPIALSPSPHGPDQDGVFSGSAVLAEGRPTVIYTGVAPPSSEGLATLRDGRHVWRETQCLAVAQDENLRTWKKLPQPVIAAPPAGLEVTGFRDPVMWREQDRWMLALGSGTHANGGMILLYTSGDLRNWTYLHPLVEGAPSGKSATNPVDIGDMWECPDFFPLGQKHVLLISTAGKVRWKVGTYARQRFTPENEGVVDWGSYYAAKTMLAANGDRILWGWIPESRADAELIAAGWAGALSLPRVLSLGPGNELRFAPLPAVHVLRGLPIRLYDEKRSRALGALGGGADIQGLAAELDLQIRPGADPCTLHLQSDDKNFVSVTLSAQSDERYLRVQDVTAPLGSGPTFPLRLHLFLDGSVLEVFVNESVALTARVYRVPSGPIHVAADPSTRIASFEGWQMGSISRNRLTSPLCS